MTRDPDDVFEALADPTRRAVIRALAEEGPSARLPVTRQAVSKHLALLQEAGLVATQGPEPRGRRYAFTPAPLSDAMGWMVDVGADWDTRLARLKRLVEDPSRPS